MAEEKLEKVEDKKTETKSQSKRKTQTQESIYTLQEFAQNSKKLFGVQKECVMAAFKVANKKEATPSEAKEIVEKFMRKEIK
ncbi:MAG TPA: hypothetical protein IAC14_04340 [Candidatus Scybalomonas excrementigallinarum]|nr:hypothetical protein [Candidatus Scybalomonas excrementigallinarum]